MSDKWPLEIVRHTHESAWRRSYPLFDRIVKCRNLRIGAEIGVAFGGHAEALLKLDCVQCLYGVDPYRFDPSYEDPMNLPQPEFDQLYRYTMNRLAQFGDRYRHIRKASRDAAGEVPGLLDFVYIDARHSYADVWEDLCIWFPKVRDGGIIGGHDYGHPNYPGVKQAVDRFFNRFGWQVRDEGEGVWWVEKRTLPISFFIPAYNAASTIAAAIHSIVNGNFSIEDEIIVVDDGSEDGTKVILSELTNSIPRMRVVHHARNKGGGAARNTAVENAQHELLFCLDSDNLLVPNSVPRLKEYLIATGADVASFQETRYFCGEPENVTHSWVYPEVVSLADCLAGNKTPCSSGNYLFTRESWMRAGGYPEFALALDAWGFGFRQLATGARMVCLPGSYYLHRYGHESYWIRFVRSHSSSIVALQILLPFLHLIEDSDVDRIMSRKFRYSWFSELNHRPLKVKNVPLGKPDYEARLAPPPQPVRIPVIKRVVRKIKRLASRLL
jgi:glycosyltransferase involved in cell wall biosynthesis